MSTLVPLAVETSLPSSSQRTPSEWLAGASGSTENATTPRVVTSEAADAFRGDPDGLWRDVMRRQPGMLAWHVNRPVDPDLN